MDSIMVRDIFILQVHQVITSELIQLQVQQLHQELLLGLCLLTIMYSLLKMHLTLNII